jgi:hypothetical protein
MVLGLIYSFSYFVGTQCVLHNYDYFFNMFDGQGNIFLFPFIFWHDLSIFTFYDLLCLFCIFFENTY